MAASAPQSLSRSLQLSAALLLLGWVVPDAITDRALFAWERVGQASGFDLVALLTPVVSGAVLLAALIALKPARGRALAGLLVGDAVIVLPLLGSAPPYPIGWWLVLILALASISVAGVVLARPGAAPLGRSLTALLPGGLLALSAFGAFTGESPAGYLAAYKAPVILWAGMFAAATSLGVLVERRTGGD